MSMQVEVVSDYSSFVALRQEWNELADNFASPLLRHEWADACLRRLYPEHTRPHIVVVRSGGQLRALAPLISVYRSGMRQLVMPGGNLLHEPCGFIHDSEAALLLLVHTLFKTGTSLILPRFNARSAETLLLQEQSVSGRRFVKSGGSSLRVRLKSTWDEFAATISPGRRTNLRGYRKRAEKLGRVDVDIVHPTADMLTPLLEEFFRIEASGWKGRMGTAALSNPHVHRFYCDYLQTAAELGTLRVFSLKIDGRTIAARIALEYGKRLWELKIAYDEAYSACAPGILLTHETLRYAIQQGLEAHEFLGQAEAWERHWPCDEDEYVSMRLYPFSLSGQLFLINDVCQVASREAPILVQKHLNGAREQAMSGVGALSSLFAAKRARSARHDPSNAALNLRSE